MTILSDNDSTRNVGEESLGIVGRIVKIAAKPLQTAFEFTHFNCEEGSKYENYYPATFMVAFIWVACFSFIIGTCVRIKMILYPPFRFYIFCHF